MIDHFRMTSSRWFVSLFVRSFIVPFICPFGGSVPVVLGRCALDRLQVRDRGMSVD